MSSVFRLQGQPAIEISAEWDLRKQVSEITAWLENEANRQQVRGGILDIGFNSRIDGAKVLVQGEQIPLPLMRQLVSLDVELWLTIYPPFSEIAPLEGNRSSK